MNKPHADMGIWIFIRVGGCVRDGKTNEGAINIGHCMRGGPFDGPANAMYRLLNRMVNDSK